MKRISIGDIFGRLVVHQRFPNNKSNKPVWLCICDCGNEKAIVAQSLQSGATKSCGCLHKEILSNNNTTHGGTGSPEFNVWLRMRQRCYNEDHKAYKYYGGSGIKMQKEWKDDFSIFLEDMGKRPSDNYTIERVDSSGDYCKENCIWTDDRGLQAYNKRRQSNNTSGKTGVFFHKRLLKWESYIWFEGRKIPLGFFERYEDAVEERLKAEIKFYGFNRRDKN